VTAATPRWFTDALAAPVQDHDVTVAGARICYRAWGQAGLPGAVLVHGTAAHARWWDHIAPFMAADGMRVAALSMSGHGDSDWRDRYSHEQWAAEVMTVAGDAGIGGPPFVIGHSLGGSVAITTAVRYGPSLAGIVVVDTPVYEGPPPPEMFTPEMGFGIGRTYPSEEAIVSRFRLVPEQPTAPYIREHVAASSVRARDNGEWGWKFDQSLFRKMAPAPPPPDDQSPAAREPLARCRVAILRAEHGLMSADMAGRLRRRLGQPVPIAELPAAGHHVLLDEPLSLISALRAVLAGWTIPEPRDLAVPDAATEG
jgi:pimeloyl-ACP methyl ester carboxylesterase